MIKFIAAAAVVCLAFSPIQKGKQFPELSGETLDGKNITLPGAAKGKKTLVGMAYSSKAEEALNTWYQPVYDKFVAKLGMFDKDYDINLYFVPMYVGLKQAAYDASLRELKKSSRKDLFPYIVFYKGEIEPYESTLKMNDKSVPYFFVLDEKGQVIYSTTRAFTEKKMEDIEELLN